MAVQALFLLTEAEKVAVEALNNQTYDVHARQIDNPLANNLGMGTLVGTWVLPARILNDSGYVRFWEVLGPLPIAVLDSETLFVPDPPID